MISPPFIYERWEYLDIEIFIGNLKTKSTYAYTTGTLGTATATVSYAYGNAKWKDLMTTYNGQSITYDVLRLKKRWKSADLPGWHDHDL